jgi:hypothetical protein
MRSALTRVRLVSDKPLDLDKHRGMAEQKQPTSGEFWRTSRTTQRTCAIGRGYSKTSFCRLPQLRG